MLYVLSECIDDVGFLTALSFDAATGALTQLARLPMTGRSTCYISFDRDARHAVVTNYWDGVIDVVRLDERTGAPLGIVQSHQQTRRAEWRQVVDREDHMANRQDGPHAHCNVFHPTYKWLFVPDLGDNCVHQYGYDAAAGRIAHQAHIPVAPGDGPRHFVFHPSLPIAYSGCELKSQVTVFRVDASDPDAVRPRITPVQRLSTLPDGWEGRNYVAEIKLDAGARRVYISNRGHDSVATFSVDPATGLLARAGVDSTLGKCPRHFGLAPCGRFAVVGDQDSDVVKVFRLCPESGRLAACVQELDVPTPNFVLFAQPPAAGAAPAPAPAAAPATPQHLSTGASEAREQARSGGIRVASPVAVCAS